MEFFNEAKVVRLKSHLQKYLVADEDEQNVRQSSNGSSRNARWIVELVDGNPHVIRLRSSSCNIVNGGYLTASEEPYLLGMTGKKVVVAAVQTSSTDWEPIKEGYRVKLRSKGGKFLRANGATPPWRNSITHDLPYRTATQDWVMWDVDVVDDYYLPTTPSLITSLSSSSSAHLASTPCTKQYSGGYNNIDSSEEEGGMEFFKKAKSVRLQSHLGKYLVADDDQETVRQSRNGSSHNARWTVEFDVMNAAKIRLKSRHGLYLTASDSPFLLGMTGKKVVQRSLMLPRHQHHINKESNSIEWIPVKEGGSHSHHVKLMTNDAKFLRANGGTPPWRNSVTHDVPYRTATQNWVLWTVDVVDIIPQPSYGLSPESHRRGLSPESHRSLFSSSSSFCSGSDQFWDCPDTGSPMTPAVHSESERRPRIIKLEQTAPHLVEEERKKKCEGRLIYYTISTSHDDNDAEEAGHNSCFEFKGHGVQELTQKLEEETGIVDIIVCCRNPVNGKLYPLRLALPPNNATMHLVLVPSSSAVARDLISSTD